MLRKLNKYGVSRMLTHVLRVRELVFCALHFTFTVLKRTVHYCSQEKETLISTTNRNGTGLCSIQLCWNAVLESNVVKTVHS